MLLGFMGAVAFVAFTQRDLRYVVVTAVLFGLLVIWGWWLSDEPTERNEAVRGRVRIWHEDLGWGVISSPDAPDEAWTHVSAIEGSGSVQLKEGDEVEFLYIRGKREGYAYLATWVRRVEGEA